MRGRYYLEYDPSDPKNTLICSLLDRMGNKRSAMMKEILIYICNRFGSDVLDPQNPAVMRYAFRREEELLAGGAYGIIRGQPVLSAIENVGSPSQEKEAAKRKKKSKLTETQAESSINKEGSAVNGKPTDSAPPAEDEASAVPQTSAATDKADAMRKNFLSFLENGFYDDAE